MERRLAAIVAVDVVGYSRLMERDEAGTLAAIRRLRSEVIDPLLAKHHGRIVKQMGDGAIAEFGSVVDAVCCAVAMQRAATSLQADVLPERRIVFRSGINLGDVVVEDGDLLGDGVIVASRLEQLCEPGGVLVSGTAYDHLQGKLDVPLDYAGEQQVKNISRPVRTYRVRMDGSGQPWRLRARQHYGRMRWAAALFIALAVAGASSWWLRPTSPIDTKPSIAVLPFENLSGSETTDRVANGITEDLITDLSHIPRIDVIARNSTEVYKGKPVDVRNIGRELNVRYVFEGSVQHEGDQIRVTAQLVDAATGIHVWSKRWDRPAQDVFAVQTEIAEQIVGQMETTYGPLFTPELAAARRKRPENLNAYELNLLGVEKQLSPTRESVEESIRILNQAVAADPNYARAWINLAWAHGMLMDYGSDWAVESQAQLEAAERAVQLDPNDAEAHSVLGNALGRNGEMGRAKVELDKALELAPSSAAILTYYVGWASTFGEPERGAAMADRAIRLNPDYQPWASNPFRHAYFMAGRYEDALRAIERQTPENYSKRAWAERAGSLAALGRTVEAQATVKEALQRYPDLTVEGIANSPGFSATERQHYLEVLPAAGIPPCASSEVLAKLTNPVRLPQCVTK
jgi:TolB-like protein/class 3 adenylate cyclase/Tfp pilus assembly protein PilF